MKNLWQKITAGLGLGVLYFWPQIAFGQIAPTCPGGTTASPTTGICLPNNTGTGLRGANNLGELLTRVLGILLGIVGLVSIVYIVIGGYKYVTSNGDPEQIESAKGTITNALIGVVVVLLAFALVRIIANAVSNNV